MVFTLVSDMHLTTKRPRARADNYVEAQKSKLQQVFSHNRGGSSGGGVVLNAGDFTDRPELSFDFLFDVLRIMEENETELYTVYGQHDLLNRQRAGSLLAFLSYFGFVRVLGPEPHPLLRKRNGVDVYGWSFDEKEPPVPKDTGRPTILVMHRLVSDGPEFPGHTGFFSPGMCFELGFDLVLSGDNHKPFVHERDGRYVVNPGSMMRREKDQKDHEPRIYSVYLDGWRIEERRLDIGRDVFAADPAGVLSPSDSAGGMGFDFSFFSTLPDRGGGGGVSVDEAFRKACESYPRHIAKSANARLSKFK